jgi:putative intracellular protease/amidase
VAAIATAAGVSAERVGSSFAERGVSLGSERVVALRRPRLALVRGEGVDPTSFGALWHLLDRLVPAPHSVLDAGAFDAADLAAFDVVVLPDGDGWTRRLDEETAQAVDRWVKAGGVLVAIGGAVGWLQKHELTAVEAWAPPKEEDEEGGGGGDAAPAAAEVADRPIHVPGAALATELRQGHLLTAGLRSAPAVLFQGTAVLLATGDPQVDLVTVAGRDPVRAGLAWPEARERLAGALLVASEERGRGRVVSFAQDPAFRVFWRATMPLFLNAVLFEPALHGQAP